jgi:hypothetical protein
MFENTESLEMDVMTRERAEGSTLRPPILIATADAVVIVCGSINDKMAFG